MKLSQNQILEAQKIQILSNTLRLQALLETLVDLEILDVESFNDLVQKKYEALNREIIEDAKKARKEEDDDFDIDDIIKHYGSKGEA